MFRASSKNYHERSAKPHNTHPLSVIGWNTIYFGFDVFQSRSIGCLQKRVFLTAFLWGGQLADREERSDNCDHLCFRPRIADTTLKEEQEVSWYRRSQDVLIEALSRVWRAVVGSTGEAQVLG